MDILGSYQNPRTGLPIRKMGQILKTKWIQANVLDTIPTYRAQADSATSFYVSRGHLRSSDACVYFVR